MIYIFAWLYIAFVIAGALFFMGASRLNDPKAHPAANTNLAPFNSFPKRRAF